jgi:hypothetical protein
MSRAVTVTWQLLACSTCATVLGCHETCHSLLHDNCVRTSTGFLPSRSRREQKGNTSWESRVAKATSNLCAPKEDGTRQQNCDVRGQGHNSTTLHRPNPSHQGAKHSRHTTTQRSRGTSLDHAPSSRVELGHTAHRQVGAGAQNLSGGCRCLQLDTSWLL